MAAAPVPTGVLETIEPLGKSTLWIDAMPQFDYQEYVLNLPEPALLNMLKFLRLPDMETLKFTCPDLSDLIDVHIRHLDDEFPLRPHFQFERCAPPEDVDDDNHIEQMCERQNSATTYYPGNRCIYLFGGETLDRVDQGPRACFNDLWKLDTGTMKWSRVIICSAPYPSPKCQASLVTWGDKLILYGGRAYTHEGHDRFFSELHFFDIATSTWHRHITPPGPLQRPLAGHSAVITENFMIMFGGFQEDQLQLRRSACLTVMDLRTQQFHHIEMTRVGKEAEQLLAPQQQRQLEEENPFPRFETQTKLVLIREGLLLLAGELHSGDYGSSVFIHFDPSDDLTTTDQWQWRRLETSGRWWRTKIPPPDPNQFPWEANRRPTPPPNCAMPNFEFGAIAEVRNSKTIRLVSLGRVEKEHDGMFGKSFAAQEYDIVQSCYLGFIRQLRQNLEAEMKLRTDRSQPCTTETAQKTCAVFEFANLRCKIENCFRIGRNDKPKALKIRVQQDNGDGPRLDDVDRWELRQTIRATVNQLHSKYYRRAEMQHLVPRGVSQRNSLLRRLSIYVAEIDIDVNPEEFKELVWTPQQIQVPSPPETHNFSLIGAHHEVVMHGGVVTFNTRLHRMGHSTLLTPIPRT